MRINGNVSNLFPTIDLDVFGPNGQQGTYKTVVDTGYLTLPPVDVAALSLPFRSFYSGQLADGSQVRTSVYEADVDWLGARRTVFVLATGVEPLVGMSMLYGSRLLLDGKDGGDLFIEGLPPIP